MNYSNSQNYNYDYNRNYSNLSDHVLQKCTLISKQTLISVTYLMRIY